MNFKIILLVTILGFCSLFVEGLNKFYKIIRTGACPDLNVQLPMDWSKTFASNLKNFVIITGMLNVSERIEGDIDIQMDAQRCDLSGGRCISFSNNTIPRVCGFIPKNPVFGETLSKLTDPPMKCNPMKKGEYISQNTTIDLSPFDLIPIQGFRWKVKIYFYKTGSDLIGCWNTETNIMAASRRRH